MNNRVDDAQWRGYSFNELRNMLLLNIAKSEVAKRRLSSAMHSVVADKNGAGLSQGINGLFSGFSSIRLMRKMLGALSYIDYAIVAFRISRRLVGAFSKAKKRKTK